MDEKPSKPNAGTVVGTDHAADTIKRDRVAIIADKSTATGFKLTGIIDVHLIEHPLVPDEVKRIVKEVSREPDIKFIITTENIVDTYGFEDFEKLRRSIPEQIIVSVIPDRKGTRRKIGEGHLYKLIGRAIGLRRNV